MEDAENQNVEMPKESSRDKLLSRLSGKYPDMDFSDDEALFGRIGGDYDEYDQRFSANRENEESLVNLFSSDPRSANFLMNWKNGENPVVALMREYGDDFREALDDPELQEKLVAARAEYLDKQANNQKMQEQAQANLNAALDNLDSVCQEGGYSEEDADKAFELFVSVVEGGIVNEVSKDTWAMFLKALNHDKTVEAAAHEAEVRGRNAKIDKEKKKKTVPENLPPTLNGAREAVKQQDKKPLGALDRYESSNDIWERGKQ